jgi:hypothetical protein
MLFVDWEGQRRLRLNGEAAISQDDPLLPEYPEAQFVVRVVVREVFPNCPRYIHKMGARGAEPLRPAPSRARYARPGLEAGRLGAARGACPRTTRHGIPHNPIEFV